MMVTVVIHPNESPEVVQMLRDNGIEVIVAATVAPGSVVINYESAAEALLSAAQVRISTQCCARPVLPVNRIGGKRKAQWKQEVQRNRR